LFSQAPQGINHQAVIRNSNGAAVTNTNLWLRVQLIQGSVNGTIAYAEEFQVNSSTTGLVNIVIGSGTPIGAAMFSDIDWSNSPYFFEISYHTTNNPTYVSMGTQQFVSVPYSLYAETANSIANDQVNDADADPTNELQDLTLNGNDLSITNGSTVNLSSLQDGTGTDDQNLTLTGTNLQIEDGNSVDLAILQDGVGTDDQTLTLTGNTLQIENGNTVSLSSINTDDQNLTLTGTNLQIEDGNSVDLAILQDGTGTDNQTLTLTGNTLQIENGNSVNLSAIQDGTGTDDQTLTLTGNTLQIENGNSVSLSSINTDNQNLTFNASTGDLAISNGSTVNLNGLSDNLGNHTATQNIALNGNYLSGDGGNEGLKVDNTGDVHFYKNVAAPINGFLYGSDKTIQTITPADIEQADQSAVLPIPNYTAGTTTGESNFAIYRDGFYSCVYPYGFYASRVYFNFAGDPPADGFEVWASSVSSNAEAYKLLDVTSPSNVAWYNFTFNTTNVGAGWYIFIKFRQGASVVGNWNFAGGMVEFVRSNSGTSAADW
jgi:uncharacterized cupredoxin-like copper-binding protein